MKNRKCILLLSFMGLMFSCSGSGGTEGEPITVTEAANEVSAVAEKYDPSVTSEDLLTSIHNIDSTIEFDSQCTYSHFFLLLSEAFSNESWPSKTGARLIEGYENEENPVYSTFDENSPYTTAFRFVSDAGLINARAFGSNFDANTLIYESDVWTLLDRFHWYYGTSAVDDFYSFCNYDQRITNCKDEGKTASDSVSVSNLIPRSGIVDWAKQELVNDNDSNIFYAAFNETVENGSGLVALRNYLKPLLESENVVTLIETMTDLHNEYGYSPLYRSLTWGFETINDQSFYVPVSTVFYCDDTEEESAPGGEAYLRTIENFGPMFSIILGSEIEGQKYVEYYADFKHLNVLSDEENSELESEKFVVGDNLMLGDSGISLKTVLSNIGYGSDHHWLGDDERETKAFYDLFTDDNLNALKGYCIYESMRHYIPLLPNEEHFDGWILGSSLDEGEKRSENANYFHQYIIPYFANGLVNHYSGTEEYKEDVALVKDLYDELRETLVEKAQSSSWLSDEGATKVKQKADNMKYFIGNTSDKEETNELLEIPYSTLTDPTLMNCISLHQRTLWERNLEMVDNPPENDFYFRSLSYSPFTANAYYMPNQNGILITMGYLVANGRPSSMSEEKLLSSFGWVVGHEIGHGFDTNGFKYDYAGNYNEGWMSDSDRSALSSFSDRFEDYLDGYEGLIGYKTAGRIVLNEALADNIGISLSLAIGKKKGFSVKGFFEEGAKNFGGYTSRTYYEEHDYDNDSHPYARCRVNKGFASFDEFHDAFLTKEGDHMYVAEEERLVLY